NRKMLLATSILTALVFMLFATRFGEFSLWWLVLKTIPGAGAIRALYRYILLLTVPIALALAAGVDRLRERIATVPAGSARIVLTGLLGATVAFGLLEQGSSSFGFSAAAQAQHFTRLAAQLPPGCAAFAVTLAGPQPDPKLNVVPSLNRKMEA